MTFTLLSKRVPKYDPFRFLSEDDWWLDYRLDEAQAFWQSCLANNKKLLGLSSDQVSVMEYHCGSR